jgi:hypothetical protein
MNCWLCRLFGHKLNRLAGPAPKDAPKGWTHALYCVRCGITINCVDRVEE